MREGNDAAVAMYRKLGYSVYRRVVEYYSDSPWEETGRGPEDAFDMRKSMTKDSGGRYVREGGEEFRVGPEEI